MEMKIARNIGRLFDRARKIHREGAETRKTGPLRNRDSSGKAFGKA